MIAVITGHKYCEITDTKDDLFKNSGKNIGNYVHYKALRDSIIGQQVSLSNITDEVVKEFDTFITSEFIFIRENDGFEWFQPIFNKIHNAGKRIVLIGVGLQADTQKDDFSIHENVIEMFRSISEYSVIGCRGEYTARILREKGITNVRVIGCPSMFYDRSINWQISKPNLPENPRIMTHLTAVPTERITKDDIFNFVDYISKYDTTYIEQTECFYSPWVPHLKPAEIDKGNELQKWYELNSEYFYHLNDWYDYCKDFDFSVGSRFHGTVIPLHQGIPGLVLTRDSRTKELCEFLNIPNMPFSEFDTTKDIKYYYDLIDYTRFNKEYGEKHKNYFEFLKENRVKYRKLND